MSVAVTMKTDAGRVTLRVLTNSEMRVARACLRRHKYGYQMRRRPRRVRDELRFGTLVHVGLEAWWKCTMPNGEAVDASARLMAALEAMRARVARPLKPGEEPISPFAVVTAEELLIGYTARWGDERLIALAVEVSFEIPLVNPATGAASRTFVLGGKVDAVVVDPAGRVHVLEHKTTGSDIGPGSLYWEKVRSLDTQVSQYLHGVKALGFHAEDCIYDVIRKPGIRPLKATPEEDRKYTKPTKADPVSRLYKNQREHDETPDEYALRLREDIMASPDRYFARGDVVRLEAEERDHAFDVWQLAKIIREAETEGYAPKNPDACGQFGGCEYLAVCTGQASIHDDAVFRTADDAHEELQEEPAT